MRRPCAWRAVEAVEIEQTLAGQLLGYGTVVVGPLALDHVPKPKSVYRLVERLGRLALSRRGLPPPSPTVMSPLVSGR